MKDTTIQLLSKADAKDVLAFELANRAFFESIIPGRGDDYYSLEQVARSIDASLEEQAEGSSYMHLIRNAAGDVVGRINLNNIVRGPVQMAEIGYRMAQKHMRQGHATRAVGLLLKDVFGKYGLHRVEAATSPHNIASQIVLLKNKFQFWGRARSSFFVNGVWHDSVLFERFDEV